MTDQDTDKLPTWEYLQKAMTWRQLDFVCGQRILDFGSGSGVTARHFSADNEVIALEPDEKMLDSAVSGNFEQLCGGFDRLCAFPDDAFDVILCHNVLEYAHERQEIVRAFARKLKRGGLLSVLKHNPLGRAMQAVVLLNDFDRANALLEGAKDQSADFGVIDYYRDEDLTEWSPRFKTEKCLGIRVFWDLQQNQEIQKDSLWRKRMLETEQLVEARTEFMAIAFFHHLFLRKIA